MGSGYDKNLSMSQENGHGFLAWVHVYRSLSLPDTKVLSMWPRIKLWGFWVCPSGRLHLHVKRRNNNSKRSPSRLATALGSFKIVTHVNLLITLWNSAIFIPILQMREPRQREVKTPNLRFYQWGVARLGSELRKAASRLWPNHSRCCFNSSSNGAV